MTDWRRADDNRLAWLVLAAGIAVAAIVNFSMDRGQTFYFDEWEVVMTRSGHSPSVFLEPYNQHPSVFPVLIYKVLLETVGLGSYAAWQIVHILLLELLVVLVYLYGRSRIGAWWALFPALAVSIGGAAASYVIQTFELTFTLSLIGIVGAVLAHDRRRDVLVVVALIVALFSSGVGITLFGAVVVLVLMHPDRRARAWTVVVPAVVYVVWWIPYHEGRYPLSNLQHAPQFMEGEFVAGVASLTSLQGLSGPVALVLAALTVVALSRSPGLRPHLWFVTLAALGFWSLTAVVRYGTSAPDAERFAYVSGVLLALLVCELAAGRMRFTVNRRIVLLAAIALVGLVVNNVGLMRASLVNPISETSRILRPELTAFELAQSPGLAPGFHPDKARAPDITAKDYFGALARYRGSPALGVADVERAAPDARAAADRVLFRALGLGVVPAPSPVCTRRVAVDAPIPLSEGALLIDNRRGRSTVSVALRRFADAPSPLFAIGAGDVGRLALPKPGRAAAYPIEASLSAEPRLRACIA